MKQTLTAADVALILKTHPNRVRELARSGALTGCRLGRTWRFTTADVEAYLDRCRPAPPQQEERTP